MGNVERCNWCDGPIPWGVVLRAVLEFGSSEEPDDEMVEQTVELKFCSVRCEWGWRLDMHRDLMAGCPGSEVMEHLRTDHGMPRGLFLGVSRN